MIQDGNLHTGCAENLSEDGPPLLLLEIRNPAAGSNGEDIDLICMVCIPEGIIERKDRTIIHTNIRILIPLTIFVKNRKSTGL